MSDSSTGLSAYALTPAGAGAMAVVRVAGRGARAAVESIFKPKLGSLPGSTESARLVYGRIVDAGAGTETVDDGMVALRPDGRDGEVVEITVHGGVRVLERVLLLLQGAGATIVGEAPAGDTTMTVLDGEVLAALGTAKTRRAVRFLALQRVALTSELDEIARVLARDESAGRSRLRALMERSVPARHLVEGATVVFAGPANAGKSTLINRMYDRGRSLVSAEAGTTRDWVDLEAAVDGVPLRVIDTAGVGVGSCDVEREAVSRGLAWFRTADVQVLVLDRSAACPGAFLESVGPAVVPSRAVVAVNKSDLEAAWEVSRLAGTGWRVVCTSGLTGQGTEELSNLVLDLLLIGELDDERPRLFHRSQWERLGALLLDRRDAAPAAGGAASGPRYLWPGIDG